ncbi:MAG: CoA-binding protein [Thermodesulfobacteriota bacterium]|nr:CoA-binding protein [Thermodesulfobacteriota bacterium]
MISQKINDIDLLLNPKTVAVFGVSRQPGFAWGRSIFDMVIKGGFKGNVYPINPQADDIEGHKAFPSISAIPGAVDLAVVALPAEMVPRTVEECGKKGVKGVILITAGFAETNEGKALQTKITDTVRKTGVRIVGPNVSGMVNLSANLNITAGATRLKNSPISVICQGGFAVGNLIVSGYSKGMGVGKYLHTGNECDLTSTDFLEYLGHDPSTKVVLMYIEGLRDGRRFLETAKRVSETKPVIVIKLGATDAGSRAVSSHTGAMAGSDLIWNGVFSQANIIRAPKMEMLLELGVAFLELPPLRGNRIAIVTMGGTWGVAITDALVRTGLTVPELSPEIQKRLRGIGMPYWASTRNPIDVGAAGRALNLKAQTDILETLLSSREIDGVVVHGMAWPGFRDDDDCSGMVIPGTEDEKLLRRAYDLIPKYEKPLIVCSYYSERDSETVRNLIRDGKRVYNDVEDAATVLSSLYTYYSHRR